MVTEDNSKLRNVKNYEANVEKKSVSTSGIKEPCCFNSVKFYHVTENLFLDVMLDYLEGVCTYTLHTLVKTLINEKKYNITLHKLNLFIDDFNYGDSAKPPKLTASRLQQYNTLKMLASKFLSTVRYLPIILGATVPEDLISQA
ncbi:hypothetical protein TKK_0015417 [Trichogramma kaykai]